MISFSNINKQYGKQLVFVDASFQLNPGEKVGLVGPERRPARPRSSAWWSARRIPTKATSPFPKRLTIGYFRQDVEEMKGRSVLDEAIAGSGRAGDLHHELEALHHAMEDPDAGRRNGPHPRALRRGAGGVRAPRRLRARSAGARSAARPRLPGRPDRWRCRARSPAAGKCASRWRACCSAGPTCC